MPETPSTLQSKKHEDKRTEKGGGKKRGKYDLPLVLIINAYLTAL
jgi:hypothetical protein